MEFFTVVKSAGIDFMGVAVRYIPSVTSNKGADYAFTVLAARESVFVTHELVVLASSVNEPLEPFIVVYPNGMGTLIRKICFDLLSLVLPAL
ncbi:uncharacterized protein ARMOST_16125 [Armillaria ostoyae]|uniref:Uncharacterized protein n=1 Tax=Armillaria ostoyae TaxID=47428 RepID=A0A284RVC0_ARMOS|nr:uncharacterized protein ARMOST_16125 [Armillaria ostoyae]